MSGAQALLITDLVDSTLLNETLGDAVMGPLWRQHDAASRALMESWRGREIARSDGFLVLFERASDAVGFAVAYHATLRALDARLQARVGVHVGIVGLRENSPAEQLRGAPRFEVDGIAVPLAARAMAAARGGQTLLTAAAVEGLDTTGLQVRGHGHWRFKGISEPVELFEVGDAFAPLEPPPDSAKAYRVVRSTDEWVPMRMVPNNLPAERDAFVGRCAELRLLEQCLSGASRLVTLLGIGGIGKTRLALRYARAWLGEYPGGAWFADLSTARSVEGVVQAMAAALDVPLGKTDPVEQIGAAIAARGPCLIILDTFEQVSRFAESTLGVWLARAGEACFVTTSREVLGIAGEQSLVLAPMDLGDATALFLQRARAASHRLSFTSADQEAIAPLARLLDCLPLAIELAAARSRVISPRMLLARMKERFTLLAARGGRLDRQMTLRATLDWSWDLLTPGEKGALAQLSVVEGGFMLEAVEAVLQPVERDAAEAPIDLLQSLIDKSFVRRVEDERFDLLQSVQAYAAEHLRTEGRFAGSGPAAARDAEIRHGLHYGSLDEAALAAPGARELDNVVAACRRAVARQDAALAARTLALAWAFLELRGPFMAGVELANAVSEMPGMPEADAAAVQLVRGRSLGAMGKAGESRSAFERALESSRRRGDDRTAAEALGKLGSLHANAGRPEQAEACHVEALDLARRVGAQLLECELLNGIGTLNDYLGRIADALRAYESALELARSLGSERWEAGVLGNLGNIYYSQGRIEEARQAYEEGLRLARALGNRPWEGNALCNLGLLLHAQGDGAGAGAALEASLRLGREIGHARLEAIALCNLGLVESAAVRLGPAQQHFESALAAAERLGDQRTRGQVLGYLGLLRSRQGAVGEGRQHLDLGRDVLQDVDDAPSLAVLFCNSAEAHLLDGNRAAGEADLAAARRAALSLGELVPYDVKVAVEQVERLLGRHPSNPAGQPPIRC